MNLTNLYNKIKKLEVNSKSEELLSQILAELQSDILTNGKVNKSIVNAFKRTIKEIGDVRPVFNQISKNSLNNYIICNGYYLIDYGNSQNNIPKELIPFINIKIKEYEKPYLNYEKLKNTNTKKIELDINMLKKIVKYNKTNKLKSYEGLMFEINEVYFNAEYLLDTLLLTGNKLNDKIFVDVPNKNDNAPMNIEFDNCRCVLLPIKSNEEIVTRQNKLMANII